MNIDIIYDLTYGLVLKLVDFTNALVSFLFTEINVIGLTFSVWQLLSGVALVSLLVAWFIKKIIPVA